jgi:hypothetical protein
MLAGASMPQDTDELHLMFLQEALNSRLHGAQLLGVVLVHN